MPDIFIDREYNKTVFGVKRPKISFANHTRLVNYFEQHKCVVDCSFENNTCAKFRHNMKEPDWQKIWPVNVQGTNINCCCAACYRAKGFLKSIYPEYLNVYRENFAKDFGFWRPGQGCILPRHMRSNICISFVCIYLEPMLGTVWKHMLHDTMYNIGYHWLVMSEKFPRDCSVEEKFEAYVNHLTKEREAKHERE